MHLTSGISALDVEAPTEKPGFPTVCTTLGLGLGTTCRGDDTEASDLD